MRLEKTVRAKRNKYKFTGKHPDRSSVGIINLGCARNLVDAQSIVGRLRIKGFKIVDIEKAQTVIVNTCSFIEDAARESVDVILDLIDLKKRGKIKKIVVAGCLAQRYGKKLIKEFKEIDGIIGVLPLEEKDKGSPVSLAPAHYAYLKICESCFNKCSFCTIPIIKGKFVSRSIDSVIKEFRGLSSRGVKEINIIGQDITAYGIDLYKQKSLARLLKEMVAVSGNVRWIRLLYAYPKHITDELIDVIASEKKICKYIDLPLQHINDSILKRMNRGFTKTQTKNLIKKIRKRITGVNIRTTFVVGFPGETDDQFNELLEFVKTMKFERVGVFLYSREEGTPAFDFDGHLSHALKKERRNILMNEQQKISEQIQRSFVGQKVEVLIDEKQKDSDDIYIGRTQYDAPEIDGVVYVRSKRSLKSGSFVHCEITDSQEYDLAGHVK